LLRPRQAGKTTLALRVAETRPSIYLDLESAPDRAKLSDPELYFAQHPDELIILDEIHRAPDIFQTLRGVIDRARRKGKRTGLFHALLGLQTFDNLLGHPVSGASWEGFVLESLLSAAPSSATASFYRTAAGAEMDLVLELGGRSGRWAIEIKRGLAPTLTKGFHSAREDLAPRKTFVVYSGTERYPLAEDVEAIGHIAMARELAQSLRR